MRSARQKMNDKLHLGCGTNKRRGFLGVDINRASDADVIHNLNIFPYPFKSNRFQSVVAEHILEHLENIPKVFEEIYRITKPGGSLYILAPHFSSVDNFTDPTHVHSFSSMSFDYFVPDAPLYNYQYSSVRFRKKMVSVGPRKTKNLLLRALLNLINRHLVWYEKRFAFIFPVGIIEYQFEVVK